MKDWKVGDRVCSNFSIEHVFGDIDQAKRDAGLGGKIDGVLTEYRSFPAYVRIWDSSMPSDELMGPIELGEDS